MTNEEAIEVLKSYLFDDDEILTESVKKYDEALRMAIEALQEPSLKATCKKRTDVISRQDGEWLTEYTEEEVEKEFPNIAKYSRPKGKWIPLDQKCEYRCDQCGKIVFADDSNELNYCCSCGADMRGEQNEDQTVWSV
mgnify:CR=1 FL=1